MAAARLVQHLSEFRGVRIVRVRALAEAAARAGLGPLPLSPPYARGGRAGLIIGYAAHPPDQLRGLVQRLAALSASVV